MSESSFPASCCLFPFSEFVSFVSSLVLSVLPSVVFSLSSVLGGGSAFGLGLVTMGPHKLSSFYEKRQTLSG